VNFFLEVDFGLDAHTTQFDWGKSIGGKRFLTAGPQLGSGRKGISRKSNRGKVTLHRLVLGGTLRAKAARGAMILGSGSVAEQASRFARNMLLIRLLAPSAFGAMAIVMSSAAIVGALTEVGLRSAVIQNPRGGEKAYLDAGWWMGMGRAITTYVIIFAMAPWVARFYGNAELSALLRVTLVSTVFDGAMSPRSILVQKEMKFGRWVAISNAGAICGVALTVILSLFPAIAHVLEDQERVNGIHVEVTSWLILLGLPQHSSGRGHLCFCICSVSAGILED
jgi:Polysaccharide biosynthesis protein